MYTLDSRFRGNDNTAEGLPPTSTRGRRPLDNYFRNNQKISDNTRLTRIMLVIGK